VPAAAAHDLVLTLLDELRSINLDHPDTQKAIEEINFIINPTGRRLMAKEESGDIPRHRRGRILPGLRVGIPMLIEPSWGFEGIGTSGA
jgi:hypothetical protein